MERTSREQLRSRAHLKEVHEAEQLVTSVVRTKEELRAEARARLGVTGRGDAPPLLLTLRKHGLSLYPLGALGALTIADALHPYAFAVLAPDLSTALGVGAGGIAGIIALKTLATSLSPLLTAAFVQRVPRRALVAIINSILWSLIAIWSGFVTVIWGLLIAVMLEGFCTGSSRALHTPLLMDSYPPEARVRSLSYYQAADSLGNIAAPLIVALLYGVFSLTWRGVFIILGFLSIGMVSIAFRLRDPGFGQWDDQKIRGAVHERHGEETAQSSEEDVSLGFFEIVRRVMLIPSVRRLLIGYAVFGVMLIPFQTFLFFFLEQRWNMDASARGLFFAMFAAAGVAGLAVFGKRGENMFREAPAKVMRLGAAALTLCVVFIALGAVMPVFGLMLAMFAIAGALVSIVLPAQNIALLSVLPSHMRPHAAALAGIFMGGVGGILGAALLGGVESRYGTTGSIISLLIPGVAGSLIIYTTGKLVPRDLDRMIDDVIEDEEIRRIKASGKRLPMLACRGIDFSYGQLQVLFGVDFTVDDGEMVALLGTNGAGKSTLLRVISGLGLPTGGSVRFRGLDITYLDAERRLQLGITQVPGGRAVFGPMTVAENLRLFGYTVTGRRRELDRAIDVTFDAFPRLAERRNQPAETLSGGEQQMLGLSKALILRPRVLLIDELSLGLSPIIVGQLLEMVRRINAEGTAVVLVEQSVNIALSLVQHAYFMEKGEMRFDGAAEELLRRDDLLRAVFLEGAAKGVQA